MFQFRLSPLNSAKIDNQVLADMELVSLFTGESTISDLVIDDDLAVGWYIDNIVEEGSRDAYADEKETAYSEMKEHLSAGLIDFAKRRALSVGSNYPFVIVGERLIRKQLDQITLVGLCYTALQLYRALESGFVEIESTAENDSKSLAGKFHSLFEKIFEYLAGYSLAGHVNGYVVMTSGSRSSQKLHRILTNMCVHFGSGEVLPYDHWNELQLAANDGGVDCLIKYGAGEAGTSHVTLVGASVQKDNVKNKILGRDEREFFAKFFSKKPAVFHSALVRPQDEHALTRMRCVDADCLLFSHQDVCDGLGKLETVDQPLKRLDSAVRKLLQSLRDLTYIDDYEAYKLH